ncbi:MAG: hypothetical protein IPI98_02200 [Chitinophagaceae bacterium]|nr:hypothetical protein [Chitinophagaceae bacterium]
MFCSSAQTQRGPIMNVNSISRSSHHTFTTVLLATFSRDEGSFFTRFCFSAGASSGAIFNSSVSISAGALLSVSALYFAISLLLHLGKKFRYRLKYPYGFWGYVHYVYQRRGYFSLQGYKCFANAQLSIKSSGFIKLSF